MRITATISAVGLLLALTACASLEADYQRDADLFRISHLVHYGELLHEYHEKVGHYPFQDKNRGEVQITFATPEQVRYLDHNPEESDTYSAEEFRSELSRVLGRVVELRFDPQQVPTTMPLYYLYAIDGDHYFFVIHLHGRYPFAANRGRGFNHLEITDSDIEHAGFWKFDELIEDPQFRAVASQLPERDQWFKHLEEKNR